MTTETSVQFDGNVFRAADGSVIQAINADTSFWVPKLMRDGEAFALLAKMTAGDWSAFKGTGAKRLVITFGDISGGAEIPVVNVADRKLRLTFLETENVMQLAHEQFKPFWWRDEETVLFDHAEKERLRAAKAMCLVFN